MAPFDAALQQGLLGVDTDLQGTLNQLEARRRQIMAQMGFSGGADANADGIPDTVNVDFSDPASQASLLQRHWQDAKRGTTTRMGARGQAFSGAHQRARDRNDRNESIAFSQLGREVQSLLGGVAGQELEARQSAGRARNELLFGAAQRAAADPTSTPQAPIAAPPAKKLWRPVVKNGKFYHHYPAANGKKERFVYIRPASKR